MAPAIATRTAGATTAARLPASAACRWGRRAPRATATIAWTAGTAAANATARAIVKVATAWVARIPIACSSTTACRRAIRRRRTLATALSVSCTRTRSTTTATAVGSPRLARERTRHGPSVRTVATICNAGAPLAVSAPPAGTSSSAIARWLARHPPNVVRGWPAWLSLPATRIRPARGCAGRPVMWPTPARAARATTGWPPTERESMFACSRI
jgi:hypothetical protein